MRQEDELKKGVQASSHLHLHNLNTSSVDKLRSTLKQLEEETDIMEAKNEDLATHISDLRTVIKHVEKEKGEELDFMLSKKSRLQDQIERCQAALRVANDPKNTMYVGMMAAKALDPAQ